MASLQKQNPKHNPVSRGDASLARLAAAAESRADALFSQQSYAEALHTAILSADLYMRARHEARTSAEKQRLEEKCTAIIVKAERWKEQRSQTESARVRPKATLASSQPPAGPPQKRPSPRAGRSLTVKEKTLLLKASKINGGVFPPWVAPPAPTEFPDQPFLDPSNWLRLSDLQKNILDDWKRPHEIYEDARIIPDDGEILDLTQDVITDCSVVASLCAGYEREKKGFGHTVTNLIYPQDEQGRPVISPSGKYIVKLFFNGCYRKVIINDHLPASKSGRALYAACRNNPSIFGPALIEKAYLKIMGGYDFPGSNSGSDLLALTGWIPEHVFLQSDEIIPSALWRRMLNAWVTGDVLITLGTGRMTVREEIELGLVGEHDYALLEMKEEDGDRMMLVKNPWSEGTVWNGAPTLNEDDDRDFDAPSPPPSEGGLDMKGLREALPLRETLPPGVFWISLENVCRNFASIYLNWNPSLFDNVYESHFSWDLSTKRSETSFGRNPQFSISNSSSTSGPVWVLLSRHLGLPDIAHEGMVKTGFISLYLFDEGGRRVYLSSSNIHRTPYVDSPQTLLCVSDFPAGKTYTLVVSSQDLSPTTHQFSMATYSISTLTINSVTEPYPYALTLSSAWTDATAGGNATCRDYPNNPQFAVTLPSRASDIALLLETSSLHPVHVKLVYSGGKRVAAVKISDIVAESGEYKRSTALASTQELLPGKYTVIASTFEPGQLGTFTLTLLSTSATASLIELPSETAGCFVTPKKGVWPPNRKKLAWPVSVGQFLGMWVKAVSTGAVRVRVLRATREIGEGEEDVVVAESGGGAFEDLLVGVRTPKVDLEWLEGGYLIVLERLAAECGGEWEFSVVSERALWVGEEMDDEDDEDDEE